MALFLFKEGIMLNINIQLFGGRGANSGFGQGINTGGDNSRVSAFYDKTDKYVGMSIHQFENAVRDKSVEYVGLFDKNGNLIIAGTSNNKGAVAIPTGHPNFKDAITLTHNHPYQGGRIIGGSFSAADVQNHLRLGLKGETRAVSNGPNENTYIFRAKKGVSQQTKRMIAVADKMNNRYKSTANKMLNKVRKDLSAQGKSLNGKDNQVYIGAAKKLWKSTDVSRYGYEYIEVNKSRW